MTCPSPINRRGRRIIILFLICLFATILYVSDRLASIAPIRTEFMPFTTPPDSPSTEAQLRGPERTPKFTNVPKPEKASAADKPMAYGAAARPPFHGAGHAKLIADLPSEYIPTRQNGRRLVVIGDVHGMLKPLQHLLEKLKYGHSGKDHLIFTGDMINKGPDSAGVISLLMELSASAVRGNHEDRVLLAQESLVADIVGDSDDSTGPLEHPEVDNLEQQHFSHGDYQDRSTARSLKKKHLDWLLSLPVILRVGRVDGLDELVVVHAGLVPGLPLKKQDPWAVMNMRRLIYPRESLRYADALAHAEDAASRRAAIADGAPRPLPPFTAKQKEAIAQREFERTRKPDDRSIAVPIDGREGRSWAEAWNEYQRLQPEGDRMSVVYGHDSKEGLVMEEFTFGLDTGCVKGRQLTALVIEGAPGGVTKRVVQVDCKR